MAANAKNNPGNAGETILSLLIDALGGGRGVMKIIRLWCKTLLLIRDGSGRFTVKLVSLARALCRSWSRSVSQVMLTYKQEDTFVGSWVKLKVRRVVLRKGRWMMVDVCMVSELE